MAAHKKKKKQLMDPTGYSPAFVWDIMYPPTNKEGAIEGAIISALDPKKGVYYQCVSQANGGYAFTNPPLPAAELYYFECYAFGYKLNKQEGPYNGKSEFLPAFIMTPKI